MIMEQFVTTFSATGRQPKQTCKQCRFRKVRCDGMHGDRGCGDCDRLNFACSFVTPQPPPTPTSTAGTEREPSHHRASPTSDNRHDRPVERRRTSKACQPCRQHKVRCSGGTPCMACSKRAVPCVYGTDGRRRGLTRATTGFAAVVESTGKTTSTDDISNAPPTPTSTPGTTSLEPATRAASQPPTGPALLPPEMQELLEFYFARVYSLSSYAFLHPQTTLHQCRDGQLEPSLSYAIAAIASYHKGPPSSRREHVEQSWAQAAEDLIWRNLESPSVPRLQALLLVVLYRVETGAFQRAYMLSALAARAAAAMGLYHERPGPTGNRTAQEVRRRLVWSLKLAERHLSTGLPEPEPCPLECVHLELPSWEHDFSGTRAAAAEPTPQACDLGSYRLCVRLEMLRRDLTGLRRALAQRDKAFPQLPAAMRGFEQRLAQIAAELPGGPALTAACISGLVDSPWLPRQVQAHLLFHDCQCGLYRMLIRGGRDAAPAAVLDAAGPRLVDRAAQLCVRHAAAAADILAALGRASQTARPLELDTAVCGCRAARLLLSLALAPGCAHRPAEAWALARAERCLAALRRFFAASRPARPVLEDLERAVAGFSGGRGVVLADEGTDCGAGMSAAARVRQRLAIHSLLRQADLSTDGGDGPSSPDGSTATSPRLPGIAALEVPAVPPSTGFVLSPRASSPSERAAGGPW